MMRFKRAVCTLNDELAKATTAVAVATSLVDRKRKAADAADEDFKSTSQMTRHRYGTGKSPAYCSVSPVHTKVVAEVPKSPDAEETQLPGGAELPCGAEVIDVDQESQDPYVGDTPSYRPTSTTFSPCSPSYNLNPSSLSCRPQNPCGDGSSPSTPPRVTIILPASPSTARRSPATHRHR
jgi:hypothetical protein